LIGTEKRGLTILSTIVDHLIKIRGGMRVVFHTLNSCPHLPVLWNFRRLSTYCLLVILFCPVALGQEDDSFEGLYLKAFEKSQAGNFKGALPIFEKIISTYGDFEEDYGFGGLYFDYGNCLLQLFRWEEARDAFKICAEDDLNQEEGLGIGSVNKRAKLALFQWGYCEQQLKNPDKAIELYQRYLDSKPDLKELATVRNAYTLRLGGALIAAGIVAGRNVSASSGKETLNSAARQFWRDRGDKKLSPIETLELGRRLIKMERWEDAKEQFGRINKKKDWLERDQRAESNYLYGLSLEELNEHDSAIKIYNAVIAVYTSYPEWSCQALERGFNLSYQIKDPKKKLAAYNYLKKMLFVFKDVHEAVVPSGSLTRIRNRLPLVRKELGIILENDSN